MAANLQICEKELLSLLAKVDNTRECLVTAIDAIRKANESLDNMPTECMSEKLKQLLSAVTQEIGIIQVAESKPADKIVEEKQSNETEKDMSTDVTELTDALGDQKQAGQDVTQLILQPPAMSRVEEQSELCQKPDQGLSSPASTEPKLEDFPVWVEMKDLSVKATSSLLPDGSFWCVPQYPGEQKTHLRQISEELRRHTMKNRELWTCDTRNMDQIVCVLSKVHGLWLRAVIEKQVSENELVLRYIDIGKTEKMSRSRLNCIPEELKSIKSLALHCCFQQEQIKVSYEMKWRFSDLTKKILSLTIKEELPGSILSRYVVCLKALEDPSVDIGEIICGQLKADTDQLDSSLPFKDVRLYNGADGQNGNISIIRDVHNYKKEAEVNSTKDMPTKDGGEDKDKTEINQENEAPSDDTEQIDFGQMEIEEKLDWGEICQTPDVCEENKMEFPPVKELTATETDSCVETEKLETEEIEKKSDSTHGEELQEVEEDQKTNSIEDNLEANAVEDGIESGGDEDGKEKELGMEIESKGCSNIVVDEKDLESSCVLKKETEENLANSQTDSTDYAEVFNEVAMECDVKRESEMVLEERLHHFSKSPPDSKKAMLKENLSDSQLEKENLAENEIKLKVEERAVFGTKSSDVEKSEIELKSVDTGLKQQESEGSEGSQNINEQDPTVLNLNKNHGDEQSEDGQPEERISEKNKFPNNLEEPKAATKKVPEQRERDDWLKQQLNGLSHPALIDREAKYFAIVLSYRALAKAYSTGRCPFPPSKELEALGDELKSFRKRPIVLLFFATKFPDNSFSQDVRLCAVGIARSDKDHFTIAVKGDLRHMCLFEVEFVCRARCRLSFKSNFIDGDELSRTEAHRYLMKLDGFIRKGLVDQLYEGRVTQQGSAIPRTHHQQAPWLKRQPPRASRHLSNENNSQGQQTESQQDWSTPPSPERPSQNHDIFSTHEPEELWSPIKSDPPKLPHFHDVNSHPETSYSNSTPLEEAQPIEIQGHDQPIASADHGQQATQKHPQPVAMQENNQPITMQQTEELQNQPQQRPPLAEQEFVLQQLQQQQHYVNMQPATMPSSNLQQQQHNTNKYQYEQQLLSQQNVPQAEFQQQSSKEMQGLYEMYQLYMQQIVQQMNMQQQQQQQSLPQQQQQPLSPQQQQPPLQHQQQPRSQQFPQFQQCSQFPVPQQMPAGFQPFAPTQQQYYADQPDRRGPSSSQMAGKYGSSEYFGSDDEPERDIRKECDVFGLSEDEI